VAKKTVVTAAFLSVWLLTSSAPQGILLAAADERAALLLGDFERALADMNTYKSVMTTENWKGSQHEYKVSLVRFKKPSLLRLDVLEGDKKGSSVVLNKMGKIRARNSLGLRKTMKPTDKRLTNIRGSTFINSSLQNKLERLREQILVRGFPASVEETAVGTVPAYRLHIDYKDPSDPVTGEDVWFDKETFFIIKNIKFENDKKVSDVFWRDIEINTPIDDSEFVL
jgi:outer membrane lipoprotein-sorting protein